MKSKALKILISMVLAGCLAATPVFGMQTEGDAETQEQGIADEEILEEELIENEPVEKATGMKLFASMPEDTSQDVEKSADSWRYEDGEILEKYESLEETEVVLPEEIQLMGSKGYGEDRDKEWIVGDNHYSGGYLKGIDVSVWQGQKSDLHSKINWEAVNKDVNEDGVYDFVIIRCGYGRNTTSRDDSEFEYNVKKCEEYGIPYGVYLYSYVENATQCRSEAAHALRLLKGHYPDFPVYYDLEDSSVRKAANSSKKKITGYAKTFCRTLDNNGYRAGVYANLNWFTNYIDKSELSDYSLWVAQWPGKTEEYGNGDAYTIWQCSSSGSVHGIYGRVDINLLVKPYSEMKYFMTYSSPPDTLDFEEVNCEACLCMDNIEMRQGPGQGYRMTGISLSERQKVSVSRTANGYSEVTDASGNTGWIISDNLIPPETPWAFEDNVLISYGGEVLKNSTAVFDGYTYGTDEEGVMIVGCTAWTGYKYYTFDDQGRAYIKKSKTKRKSYIYSNPGSGKQGSLKRGKSFYVLKTSGKWTQMADGLWIKTGNTKKTAVYPTIRPSEEVNYVTKMKKKSGCYTGPSTSYIKKKTLYKNKKVTVVGKYGTWAQLSSGYWVPQSKLK